MSLRQIADTLNSKEIKTKHKNTAWTPETVKGILKNEKYSGDAILQKTYVTDCITKTTRKNNGELPMYIVKNHHEPIISRNDFNRVQEEMARRSAKRTIAEKLTKTEQGKYSAKYALSELLICGECGTHYRRVTWTAKGFKEIKWRCINRIQYGKKKCHNSPTIDEEPLQRAIMSAINEFCEVRNDVAKVLRESVTEEFDVNLNGSVEMKTLREFIETEKAKQASKQQDSDELNAVLEQLEKTDFIITEYDDVVVRQLIEKVTVIDKNTITVTFKGGFEIRRGLNSGN